MPKLEVALEGFSTAERPLVLAMRFRDPVDAYERQLWSRLHRGFAGKPTSPLADDLHETKTPTTMASPEFEFGRDQLGSHAPFTAV